MPLTIYYMEGSTPCDRVYLTAKLLNVELDRKYLDFIKDEQLLPEFLKLNPQHTCPTLVDGDFIMWESRAICRYLVNKYGPGSTLYPQDPVKRAKVDQQLDFDFCFYERFADYFYPQLFDGKPADEEILKKIHISLGFLNTFLESDKYVAGDTFTIADCALVSTISVIESANILDLNAYPNVVRWFDMVKSTVPEYSEVKDNVVIFKALVDRLMNKTA